MIEIKFNNECTGLIYSMFQVESSRTLELECISVSPVVLWCGDSVWDFVSSQVSHLLMGLISNAFHNSLE